MATLQLKVSLDGGAVVKTIQFDSNTTVYDACRIVREKVLEANVGDPKDFGLFLTPDEESMQGIWLEPARTLGYYMLRSLDTVHYKKKTRNLRVRMLDGSVKTLLVDDSQIVANLMVVICTKIGITNYDEYGLVREEQKEEHDVTDKPNYGTLTLKRKNIEKERDAKMDQLRKKLRTDDEVNWVEPSKTLLEQGIDVTETLLLRRKLFYSDRNVDSRDPVQLNLLYVQARDSILDGTHPVIEAKALEFAGIQAQIQFGDHKEDKHTPGILDLKEFLPASYVKTKGIEKKLFKEHRNHTGLSELDAKVLYTKSARELNTYGVAFFLVKEKMKGKNKLVPRLLGVTKDSVLRLDEKTKETLQSWPLTTVRRWCASPNTFTLDFGDYSDQYYSVQTTEAEQILQVIAGYIDIIMRRKRAADHLGIDGDEGSVMQEESISPHKASIIQHDTFKSGKVNEESLAKPAVLRPGAEGAKSFAVGHMTSAQQTTISGQIITGHAPPNASQMQQTRVTSVLTEPQRALLSSITTGREIIKQTETHLTRAQLPELGEDAASLKWKATTMHSNKQLVTSQIAAMNAATAQVVTLTSGPTEEVDHTAVGAAITTITSNLPEMSKGVQMIAALLDDTDNGDRLLDATRKMCAAFSDLLKAAEPEAKEPRQNLLNAASRVGEASTSVLYTIGEETEEDKETQDILLSLAKSVANTTAALVLKAKNVAASCKDDQQAQTAIISAATQCALATSQLVACAKVVAPTLHNPACREQLTNAARQVMQSVEQLLASCANAPQAGKQELTEAAKRVTEALESLLQQCAHDRQAQPVHSSVHTVETVMVAGEQLVHANTPSEMLKHARSLGEATARLISDIKTEAEQQPSSDAQRKLIAAAKLLADATAKMVEAARQCASSPQDRDKQVALRKAAEELRYITVDYAQGQDIVSSQVSRLWSSANAAASAAQQLVTAANAARPYNTNTYSQETLLSECSVLSEQIPHVADAVKICQAQPEQPAAQLDLIYASEALLQPSGHVIQSARAALPTITDGATAKNLADTTQYYTASVSELRHAVYRARISTKGLEMEAASDIIRSLQQELDDYSEAARAFELRPLPGQTAEWASTTMNNASRQAASHTAQLISAVRASEPAQCSKQAAGLAASLRNFTAGVRAAAANTEPQHQERVISSGYQVLESSVTLVETVKHYMSTTETVDVKRLLDISKSITQGLERTVESVPTHAELDNAMENISETLNILNMGELPTSDRNYSELQSELNSAAAELNSRSSRVAQSVEHSQELGPASARFDEAFTRLCGTALEMAGHTQDVETRTLMINSMKTVTVNSSRLLATAKSVSQDLTRPNAKNQLAAAARAVTESINRLMDVCTQSTPGQKECEAAIRSIQSTLPLLNSPTQPVCSLGYCGCLDTVVEQAKCLSEGMSGMASAVKTSEHDKFAAGVSAVSDAVCGLVECTAQAAYLVAVSDPTSVAGRPGLVDQAQFARAAVAIQQACADLCDRASPQQQVLSAATIIAKHTSALCNACRVASSKTTQATDKRHFVQAAKDVANCTAALVKEIKALDSDYSDANRSRCAAATVPLQDAVRSLCQFADSAEFASIPARISAQAAQRQRPILDAGRNIISGSCSMVQSGQALAVASQDREHWQALATHSKTVSDSIKRLVQHMRELAPGQTECADALETIGRLTREIDQAAIAAVAQELTPKKGYTLQGYAEQIENSAREVIERLEPLRTAAKSEAENLGHAVVQLVSYLEPLVSASLGLASGARAHILQGALLGCARTVLEALQQLVSRARHAANTSAHAELDSLVQQSRSALTELMTSARAAVAEEGAVGPLLDTITRATARLTEHRMSLLSSYDENDSYADYQSRMVAAAKEVSRLATDMTAKSATDPSRLVHLGGDMCASYERLATDSVGASATAPNANVANNIRQTSVELGAAVSTIIRAGGSCRLSATASHQRDVSDAAKHIHEKVVQVLSALQAGSRGTQACIDAASTIAAIIGDLDTTILFASAGTIQSDREGDTFSDHRENILKTAKTLVEDTKSLVGAAAGTQDELASAAHSSQATIVQLCEVVKQGAMSLGAASPESQVLLLHAARDVAAALRDLAVATTGASGKVTQSPHMQTLKHAAKRLSDETKRWSLPVRNVTLPRTNRRRSINLNVRSENTYDSETDFYQSDMEEELIKLLDYSSQEDDVSPSIFHDNCEEVIAYIESLMRNPVKGTANDELNERYNLAAKNSLIDMDWRVLKYGENILLGEVKKMVDLFADVLDRAEIKRKREKLSKLKASTELDSEMNRLSQVLEDLEDVETEEPKVTAIRTINSITTFSKRPKLEEKLLKHKLKSLSFKIKKVKPVNLVINLELKSKTPEIKSIEPVRSPDLKCIKPAKSPEVQTPEAVIEEVVTPIETNKDETIFVEVKPDVVVKTTGVNITSNVVDKNTSKEFWTMFKDDSDWWRALAKRNLERMEQTRKELARFSGNELVLGNIENEISKYNIEKETLQKFIDEVDNSKIVKKDLEYNKKYEDMVLKLINFAKKDIVYKGFDPLLEQLKALANLHIEKRKKKVHIHEIIKIYSEIDISKYTYEELCLLEQHYKDILKKHKQDTRVTIEEIHDKENVSPRDREARSPSLIREDSPSYHKNVILNIHSQQNLTKNINQYSNISNSSSLKRSQKHRSQNNSEIFDLTRTYPEEYYANNWWSIYEDILKNREHQYGSIDNWWSFYEAILNNQEPDDKELSRIRSVVEYRNSLRKRPNSRVEEQLRMLDEIKNDNFKETEDVSTKDEESVMVTNVTSLLKTVKAVEDEHTRGTRALESTIEAITQEIAVLMSPSAPKSTATPEELIRHTRQMTAATAKAVAAGNGCNQDQLTAAANLGRKAVVELLVACKGAAHAADTDDLRARTLQAGRNAAVAYRALLGAVLGAAGGDSAAKGQLPHTSRAVAAATADIIAAAELLKGSDWVDPEDPTVIAENELLGAAASIDAAAKKLDSLRPRKPVTVQETDESLNFDEMILEAAKSIIKATSALVRAAGAAQRELIDQGKVARRPVSSSDDGQWSEGLVSGARLVAAAAHTLVEAANALVQGAGSEERLISSARQVASSTAQLLVACKVKADPSSESTRRLQAAGAEVIRSTQNLVRAAENAIHCEEETSLVLNRKMVGGIAQEIDARSDVLRIEKELEDARLRLNAIRKAKYELRTGDTSGGETDTDAYVGGYSSDASGTLHRAKRPTSSLANTTYSPNSSYTPHHTQNSTNLSQHISQLNQSIHGTPQSPGYNTSSFGHGGYGNNTSFGQTGYTDQSNTSFGQNQSYGQSYGQNTLSRYGQNVSGQDTSRYSQGQNVSGQDTSRYSQGQNVSGQDTSRYSHGQNVSGQDTSRNSHGQNVSGQDTSRYSQGQNVSGQDTSRYSQGQNVSGQDTSRYSQGQNVSGQDTSRYSHTEYNQNGSFAKTSVQSPSFSSFRSQDDTPKQNYEGFTTREDTTTINDRTMNDETETETTETTVVVRTLEFPKVRTAHLVTDDSTEKLYYKKEKPPPPPPRKVTLANYETRLYDTPRPSTNEYSKTEERRQFESNQFIKQEQRFGYDAPKLTSPISPKFNARELKFEEPLYSTLNKPGKPKSPFDGVGQTFTEHQKSTEAIPGGTKHSEYTVKSESYQSTPKQEFFKTDFRQEVKSPFTTSTPSKLDRSEYYSSQQKFNKTSTDLVKAATPDYDRISSPYGKDVQSYGGPNFKEETTTEVKEIPNGTQKITTTKIYSSSPVNITTTNTKFEPVRLEGIDELSKSFDNDSKYSTIDSRFNTLDSKVSSDTNRSFMRPSEFQTSDYQSSTSISKVKKPSDLVKEFDSMDKKFAKQTIKSETIERKSVMTSSHKSETSSTVTKKFGNA